MDVSEDDDDSVFLSAVNTPTTKIGPGGFLARSTHLGPPEPDLRLALLGLAGSGVENGGLQRAAAGQGLGVLGGGGQGDEGPIGHRGSSESEGTRPGRKSGAQMGELEAAGKRRSHSTSAIAPSPPAERAPPQVVAPRALPFVLAF